MLSFVTLLIFGKWITNASGCFGDPIFETNEVAIVNSSVNLRSVACMDWSEIIKVVKTSEKVRVIAKDASRRYKVITSDWKIGWIAQQFLTITQNTSEAPVYPENYDIKSLCDTVNPAKCPAGPVAPWVMPTRIYRENTTDYEKIDTEVKLENYKKQLDKTVSKLLKILDKNYDQQWKTKKIETIITVFEKYGKKNPKFEEIIKYMINLLENEIKN